VRIMWNKLQQMNGKNCIFRMYFYCWNKLAARVEIMELVAGKVELIKNFS
jgi:hypothetical protein